MTRRVRSRLLGVAISAFFLAGLALRASGDDAAARLQAFERHVQMAKASPFRAVKWQFIGPKNMSGRCTDVAVVAPRGKSYTIYVATASGGLWKTDNEATTWQP